MKLRSSPGMVLCSSVPPCILALTGPPRLPSWPSEGTMPWSIATCLRFPPGIRTNGNGDKSSLRFCFSHLTLVPQHPSCQRARVSPLLNHLPAVDEEVNHAGRVLMWLVEGGAIAVSLRIEDDDVGEVAGFEVAALGQFQDVGGQAAGAAD